MLCVNPRAIRGPYPDSLKQVMNIEAALQSRRWLAHWDQLSPQATPLWDLPGVAARLGVGSFCVKDESTRSPLGSFKALGAPIALIRLILRMLPQEAFEPEGLITGQYRQRLQQEQVSDAERQQAMNAVNPKLILRNYLAQQAIESAEQNDVSKLARLHQALLTPFADAAQYDDLAALPPDWGKHLEISCSS
mgnify:CR=1 FL=1